MKVVKLGVLIFTPNFFFLRICYNFGVLGYNLLRILIFPSSVNFILVYNFAEAEAKKSKRVSL